MEIIVNHHLKLAESMDPFLHAEGERKGRAILNMPYWVKIGGDWWFEFIHRDMDKENFKKHLNAGAIYYLNEIRAK